MPASGLTVQGGVRPARRRRLLDHEAPWAFNGKPARTLGANADAEERGDGDSWAMRDRLRRLRGSGPAPRGALRWAIRTMRELFVPTPLPPRVPRRAGRCVVCEN